MSGGWLSSQGFGPDDARHALVVGGCLIAMDRRTVGPCTVSRETVHGPLRGQLLMWGSVTALLGVGWGTVGASPSAVTADDVWKSTVDYLVDNWRTRIAQVYRALWIIRVGVEVLCCLDERAVVRLWQNNAS